MRRLLLALAIVVVPLLGAGCGDDHEPGEHMGDAAPRTASAATSTTERNGTTTASGGASESDVTFAQNMIPHHEQAVEMAEVALDPAVGASDEVRDLATRIRDAQDPEIEQMRGWLRAWGASEMEEMSDDEHGAHGMEGMMSADEMAEMGGMRGPAFDRMWMQMMIRHHEGAIAMAETARAQSALEEVDALSDAIIEAQQEEIDEMQALLEAA